MAPRRSLKSFGVSHTIFGNCANIWTFLVLFSLCYLIETITFTYLISTVQSIERQFQIPSKLSGFLTASSDIGYVLTVVVLAYMGNKGNRARWIGAGCLLIAFACLLASTPHYIFSKEKPQLTEAQMFAEVGPSQIRLADQYEAEMNDSLSIAVVPLTTPLLKRKPFVSVPSWENFEAKKREKLIRKATSPVGYCQPIVNKIKSSLQHLKCQDRQTNDAALTILFIGIMLVGVGHSMPWSLGMPYIDDHVKKQNTPLYFGGVFFIRIIGPVLGFVLGGACMKIYYQWPVKAPEGLTLDDPRWIGAWWLGFLIIGIVLCVPSVLLFLFPDIEIRHNRKTAETVDNRTNGQKSAEVPLMLKEKEAQQQQPQLPVEQHHDSLLSPKTVKHELQEFTKSVGHCLRSPVYTIALVGRMFDTFSWKGFFVFVPKYLEVHYGLSQDKANYVLAGAGVFGFATGILIGSIVLRKFKLEGRQAALLIGICSLISALFAFAQAFLGCNSIVNSVGMKGLENNFNMTTECNVNCGCDSVRVYPVCSKLGTFYYSPCHAGCLNYTYDFKNAQTEFQFCKCIDSPDGVVSRNYCEDDCKGPMLAYFALKILGGIIGGMAVIPGILMILRSIPVEIRSIGLGFSGFAVSLISTFPSPIVYGAIVDTACIKHADNCGFGGNCELYNSAELRKRMHIFMGVLRGIALLFDVGVWYYAKNLKLMEEEDLVAPVEVESPSRAEINQKKSWADDAREEVRAIALGANSPGSVELTAA